MGLLSQSKHWGSFTYSAKLEVENGCRADNKSFYILCFSVRGSLNNYSKSYVGYVDMGVPLRHQPCFSHTGHFIIPKHPWIPSIPKDPFLRPTMGPGRSQAQCALHLHRAGQPRGRADLPGTLLPSWEPRS